MLKIKEPTVIEIYGKPQGQGDVAKVNCIVGSTLQGTVNFPGQVDTVSCRMYKTISYTGLPWYPPMSIDMYTGTICSITGLDTLEFTIDPKEINAPTGAINGELYAVKFVGTCTGINPIKSTMDLVIEMKEDIL